jgi:Xaa-Pro aminopeptidase
MQSQLASTRQKTTEQVAAIEETQHAVEAAFAEVILYLQSASVPTSGEARAIIERVLESRGAESSEGLIVAGGIASAEPHERGSGVLRAGEPIVIDIFPRSKKTGYFADMTRTVCIDTPSEQLQKMYDAVLAAQLLAISMVKPGIACKDIQEAVEHYFEDAGFVTSGKGKEFTYAEGFVHSIGHGVGRAIHEPPRFGKKSEDVLIEGEVITIEPGLYIQGCRRHAHRGYGARHRRWVQESD